MMHLGESLDFMPNYRVGMGRKSALSIVSSSIPMQNYSDFDFLTVLRPPIFSPSSSIHRDMPPFGINRQQMR